MDPTPVNFHDFDLKNRRGHKRLRTLLFQITAENFAEQLRTEIPRAIEEAECDHKICDTTLKMLALTQTGD
jgi:hypothetical protein